MISKTVTAPLPSPTPDHSATCRETMRLLRRMLARMPWAHLPFAQRQRLSREVQRLQSDLNLALLILEKGKSSKPAKANSVTFPDLSI